MYICIYVYMYICIYVYMYVGLAPPNVAHLSWWINPIKLKGI